MEISYTSCSKPFPHSVKTGGVPTGFQEVPVALRRPSHTLSQALGKMVPTIQQCCQPGDGGLTSAPVWEAGRGGESRKASWRKDSRAEYDWVRTQPCDGGRGGTPRKRVPVLGTDSLEVLRC